MSLNTTKPSTETVAAIAKQTEMFRIALFWLSQHPELTPLASILGNYAAARAMNACLGPNMCSRCEHCLEYLGVHLHDAGLKQLYEYSMTLAYQQALKDPVRSIGIAMKSIQFVTDAVKTLATLPDHLKEEHAKLSELLWQNKAKRLTNCNKGTPEQDKICSMQALKDGMEIYNKQGDKKWGDWLHLGLPPILHELQSSTFKSQAELTDYIKAQYDHWRQFGQSQLSLLLHDHSTQHFL